MARSYWLENIERENKRESKDFEKGEFEMVKERIDKEEKIGKYSKDKYWIHREPKYDIKKRRFMHKIKFIKVNGEVS